MANPVPVAIVEWGVESREWGVGSREWGVGSREWGVGSRETRDALLATHPTTGRAARLSR